MSGNDNLHLYHLRDDNGQECVPSDLEKLCCKTEEKAVEAIHWYLSRKTLPKALSKISRATAIFFVSIGGLIPLLNGAEALKLFVAAGWMDLATSESLGEQWSQAGYVAFALAAISLAADRFSGFSSKWMRYITTEQKLQRLLAEFQMDWALLNQQAASGVEPKEGEPTLDQQKLERLKDFRLAIHEIIETETEVWVKEFKTSLADLANAAEKRGDEKKPPAKS